MNIDFSKLTIKKVDGTPFSQEETKAAKNNVCDRIYAEAMDIPTMELAVKVYHADGEVELSNYEVELLKRSLEKFPAFIRKGFTDFFVR